MAGSARRALLNSLIASLCIAAFVAIVALLSGEDSEGAGRVIATFIALALYSSTSLAALTPAERPGLRPLAVVILGLSCAGLLTGAIAIWEWSEDDGLQRLAWSLAVAAVSAAHLGLIAARAREDDPRSLSFGEAATAAAVLILAVLAVRAIAAEIDDEDYFRVIGMVAIVDAYGTFVIPLIRLLRMGAPGGTRRGFLLVLVCVLTMAAAAGIVGLVRNSVDEDLTRLLATLPFVALFGATALAGSVVRRTPAYELLGGATILASGLALAAMLNLIWVSDFSFDGGSEGDLELAWILLVAAATLAHVSVLIVRRRPGDSAATRALVRWAVGAAVVAGLLLVYAVDDDADGAYAIWLAIVLILDVLATSLVALVRKRDSATA